MYHASDLTAVIVPDSAPWTIVGANFQMRQAPCCGVLILTDQHLEHELGIDGLSGLCPLHPVTARAEVRSKRPGSEMAHTIPASVIEQTVEIDSFHKG